MEPHSHIGHNSKKHIDFYVKKLCSYVSMWFKLIDDCIVRIVNKFYNEAACTAIR